VSIMTNGSGLTKQTEWPPPGCLADSETRDMDITSVVSLSGSTYARREIYF
jgi:hypothetical protein